MIQILSFRNNPLEHIHYCFPWGEPGTLFAEFKGPRPHQLDDIKALTEFVQENEFRHANGLPLKIYREARSSGRGPGKSAKFAMIAHWFMSTRIGAPVICAANTEAQLRNKLFAEFGMWFGSSINAHWWNIEAMKITPQSWLTQLVSRPHTAGGLGIEPRYWYCLGQTWDEDNPNAFAGAHNPHGMMVMFDEADGIPGTIWDVTEGFFTESNPYRFHFAASQTRNRQSRFAQLFEDPRIGMGWDCKRWSTRGMEGVDQEVIRNQIARYGEDSDFVRTEIDGLPPKSDPGQFIPMDHFKQAMLNDFPRHTMHAGEETRLVLGVDPAPRGRTVLFAREGRNARDCIGKATLTVLEGLDNLQIAEKILELDRKFKFDAICIDFGMGTGVIDYLRKRHSYPSIIHEVRFGMTAKDAEDYKDGDEEWFTNGTRLWARVRDWLPGAMIPQDDGAPGELSYEGTNRIWQWAGREGDRKILEAKKEMAKRGVASPDKMDALAATFCRDDYPARPKNTAGVSGGYEDVEAVFDI